MGRIGDWRAGDVTSFLTALGAALLLAQGVAAQTIWYVDDDSCPGPGTGSASDPFCKVQEGIDSAVDGDTVLVRPGTYVENIDFLGKAIHVRSDADGLSATFDSDPEGTILDGNQAGSVVTFANGEGLGSVLEGFTITNGSGKTTPYASRAGGGIYCESSSPTIRHNVIKGNMVGGGSFVAGGGFYGLWCHGLTFTNNTVEDNKAGSGTTVQGGGFYCKYGDNLNMTSNVIVRNLVTTSVFSSADGGGVTLIAAHGVAFHNNIVAKNIVSAGTAWGSGILLSHVTIDIRNATIANNTTAWAHFGCATQFGYHWSNVTVTNSVVWFDTASNALGCYYGNPATATYSNIQGGYPGTGNIDADPLFADAAGTDYRLQLGSPCIDAGDPASAPTGTDLVGNPRLLDGDLDLVRLVDMGAYEFDNVHLEVTSAAPTPGSTLAIDTSGSAGLSVWLFVGTAPGEFCLDPFGCVFFDLASTWVVYPWGSIPSSVVKPIPLMMPVPISLVFQELAVDLGTFAGNTSNPVEVTIQ
jgi:hypothetical protein